MSHKFWDFPQFKRSNIRPFNDPETKKLIKQGVYDSWKVALHFWIFRDKRGQKVFMWKDGTVLTENFL